ncbi:hypothetical protein IE53DRAFT_321065 [Violaceomyces palustris]|uniref:Uncharacterized protein n=1 Tax=Violaceomyces palustris TaxID=1673888 RepID=A0ACD0NP47_9BASI|nr:hypothetical protein IE53DRAFT_321065 [Violaceomyces palustris]
MSINTASSSSAAGAAAPIRTHPKHPFLSRPLYAFDLPADLVQSLKLRSIDAQDPTDPAFNPRSTPTTLPPSPTSTQPDTRQTATDSLARSGASVPACTLCPSCKPFPTVNHQRAHFRSDWHRLNVQLNLRSAVTLVGETEFQELLEQLDEDDDPVSTEDEGSKQGSDIVSLLVQKLEPSSNRRPGGLAASDDDVDGKGPNDGGDAGQITARSPLLWFVSGDNVSDERRLENVQLGFYRGIFPEPGSESAPEVKEGMSSSDWYVSALESIQHGRLSKKGSKDGWSGKRIKSQGVQEAAKAMMMGVLDGQGYVPGLSLDTIGEDDLDEEDEEGRILSSSGEDEEGPEDDGRSESIVTTPSVAGSVDPRRPEPKLRTWTVILMGGGHFAAAVIALNPHVTTVRDRKKGSAGTREERSILLLAHKTFHRYTTRRKQGGSQSAQDASGKFAKSAGAQLRRYNESALGDDVRRLLDHPGWRQLIGSSEKVWIRSGARASKGVLWSWEGVAKSKSSPLEEPKEDGRMDHLPFPTRRPTIGETVRCFFELTRVRIERKTEEQLAAVDEAYRASLSAGREAEARQREARAKAMAKSLAANAEQKKSAVAKLSEEEKARRLRFERLVEMVRKGKMGVLVDFLSKHEEDLLRPRGWGSSIDSPLPAWWRSQEARRGGTEALVPCTLLQLACEGGNEEVVRYLLVERRADPTLAVTRAVVEGEEGGEVENGGGGAGAGAGAHRTAYDLCSTKESRNVFRRMMAEQPEWYNWGGMGEGGARVPSALTDELAGSQSNKAKERRAALREKARERAAKAEAKKSDPAYVARKEEEEEERRRQEEEEERRRATTSSTKMTNRLGGKLATPSALLLQQQQQAGLTPEMRMRIEREKRARAAEERIKALQAK